jgi:hypothetical protein
MQKASPTDSSVPNKERASRTLEKQQSEQGGRRIDIDLEAGSPQGSDAASRVPLEAPGAAAFATALRRSSSPTSPHRQRLGATEPAESPEGVVAADAGPPRGGRQRGRGSARGPCGRGGGRRRTRGAGAWAPAARGWTGAVGSGAGGRRMGAPWTGGVAGAVAVVVNKRAGVVLWCGVGPGLGRLSLDLTLVAWHGAALS